MRFIALVAAALLSGLASSAAWAGQMPQTEQTSWSSCGPACPQGFDFQQFQPWMGELQSVSLAIAGIQTYFVSLAPDPAAKPPCCDAQAIWQFNTGFAYYVPGLSPPKPATAPPITSSSPQFAGAHWSSAASTADPPGRSFSVPVAYMSPISAVGDYLGNGDIVLYVGGIEDSPSSADLCLDLGIRPACSESFSVAVTLTYNFIPEPTTLLLVGTGLLGIPARRRPRVGALPTTVTA